MVFAGSCASEACPPDLRKENRQGRYFWKCLFHRFALTAPTVRLRCSALPGHLTPEGRAWPPGGQRGHRDTPPTPPHFAASPRPPFARSCPQPGSPRRSAGPRRYPPTPPANPHLPRKPTPASGAAAAQGRGARPAGSPGETRGAPRSGAATAAALPARPRSPGPALLPPRPAPRAAQGPPRGPPRPRPRPRYRAAPRRRPRLPAPRAAVPGRARAPRAALTLLQQMTSSLCGSSTSAQSLARKPGTGAAAPGAPGSADPSRILGPGRAGPRSRATGRGGRGVADGGRDAGRGVADGPGSALIGAVPPGPAPSPARPGPAAASVTLVVLPRERGARPRDIAGRL